MMDDAIDLDYEPDNELDITSSELPKAHSQRSPEHTELPPAAVVESKPDDDSKQTSSSTSSVLRASVDASGTITRSRSAASGTRSHQRVRYRSSSSTSSNSAHSPSRHRKHLNRSASPIHYPSPLYLKTGADQAATNDVQIEQRRAHRAKRYFGIDPPREDCPVTQNELFSLYKSMGVDPYDENIRLRSVYVRGVDDMNEYQIEKIFAEYAPISVEMLDEGSCNVIWNDVYVVGKMILEMTKALKRIRRGRVIEEGEVAEGSDEEEGEMKEEQGDEVTIQSNTPDAKPNQKRAEPAKLKDDFVEIDVGQVMVPPGKWRVITKHVGQSRLLILRFSTREELKRGRSKPNVRMIKSESKDVIDRDGFSYKWTNQKNRVRPGLNIFNKDGDELEWDYEHDTRFYVDLDVPEKTPPIPTFTSPLKQQSQKMAEKSAEEDKTDSILGKRAVKTKGRGSKRFKALGLGGSMAADDEEKCQEERKRFSAMHYHDMDDESEDDLESDLDSDRDPSPTPQPWDKVKSSGLRSRITRPSSTVPRRDY